MLGQETGEPANTKTPYARAELFIAAETQSRYEANASPSSLDIDHNVRGFDDGPL